MSGLTLDDLERLCLEYDRVMGDYPEHQYEGWSVFWFLRARLAGKVVLPGGYISGDDGDESSSDPPDNWVQG